MRNLTQKALASVMVCGLSFAGASAIVGCDREVSSNERVETKSDGTMVKEKETVKQTDQGMVKEKEKTVEKVNP